MHNSEGFGSLTPHLELHWVEEKIFILKKRTLQSLKRKEKEDLINWSDPCLCKILYSGVWTLEVICLQETCKAIASIFFSENTLLQLLRMYLLLYHENMDTVARKYKYQCQLDIMWNL